MAEDLHNVHTFCNEGNAFDNRHRHELNETQRAMGSVVWGFLRALAECPTCPGVFRASPDDWTTLVCPQCRGVWVYTPQATEPPAPTRKPRRRTTP